MGAGPAFATVVAAEEKPLAAPLTVLLVVLPAVLLVVLLGVQALLLPLPAMGANVPRPPARVPGEPPRPHLCAPLRNLRRRRKPQCRASSLEGPLIAASHMA